MQHLSRFCRVGVLLLTLAGQQAWAQDGEVRFRVDIVGAVRASTESNVTSWVIDVAPPVPDFVDVEIEVVLVSRLEPCVANPAVCVDGENFVRQDERGVPTAFGCSDGIDNDDNGLADVEDPNCRGVASWRMSVAVDEGFSLSDVTTAGTVGDLMLFPPGRRNVPSAETTGIVDPAENEGQHGATSFVGLSWAEPVVLDLVSESVVLKVTGRMSTEGLVAPGDITVPLDIKVVDPRLPGLARPNTGGTQVISTRVFLNGVEESVSPDVLNATVHLRVATETPTFFRGDANASGATEITDGIFIVNHLFLGGSAPTCQDAADANDDGDIYASDPITIFGFLFLGGTDVPPPRTACGPDGTADAVDCESFAACR